MKKITGIVLLEKTTTPPRGYSGKYSIFKTHRVMYEDGSTQTVQTRCERSLFLDNYQSNMCNKVA